MKKWIICLFLVLSFNTVFAGKVEVKKVGNNWQLIVDGQPFIVKGVNYDVSKIGEENGGANWKKQDYNANGKLDGAYEAWIDKNKNNIQNSGEPTIGDFKILQDMGCNAIRDFLDGNTSDYTEWKSLYRYLYENFGIKVLMANFLGAYGIGSGSVPTSYLDDTHKTNMMKSATNVVRAYKDEPYIIMWILGNENNYDFTDTDACDHPVAYAQFLNKVAAAIHTIDPDHPVALCNGDVGFLSEYNTYAPNIDIFSLNSFRGSTGFGDMWSTVKDTYDRPVMLTEYGGPWEEAWEGGQLKDSFEDEQYTWHKNCWEEIVYNSYNGSGIGNSIGGTVVHWLDRWHEHGGISTQDEGDNGGICSQGDGSKSPFLRQLRPVYSYYQEAWASIVEEGDYKLFKTKPRNYPNPFLFINNYTLIRVRLKEKCEVVIKIYDLKQNLIKEFEPEIVYNYHEAKWYGKNDDKEDVASGIYFCYVKAESQVNSKEEDIIFKIMVIK